MAEADTLIPLSQSAAPPPKSPQNQPRICSDFLSKAIVASVFIVLLPLFPSQAPEFINLSIFTRSWELLHLLIVGIAISYGLFSRRNADHEVEKEPAWKSDSPQSYVAQILHVSPVFDDEEAETPPSGSAADESKIETWNSQYHRGEPVVVLAKKSNDGGKSGAKPLFFPVRSLRTSAPGLDSFDEIDEHRMIPNGIDEMGNEIEDSRNEHKDCVVLPSPIPWRSRSGRMEYGRDDTLASPPPAIDTGLGSFKTPSFRSPVPPSSSNSPSATSPSPSRSPEPRAMTSEELGRKKKSFSMASPPPAPPPPPLPLNYSSHPISNKNDTRRSFKEELKDLSARERARSMSINDSSFNVSKPEMKQRSISMGTMDVSSSFGRSVRTVRFTPDKISTAKATSDQPLEKMAPENRHPSPLPTYQTEKRNGSMEKFVMVASDDSDGDDDSSVEPSSDVDVEEEETPSHAAERAVDENEVDKKADEFIAKFREQIRLQRIESIKRSTGQRSTRRSSSSSK